MSSNGTGSGSHFSTSPRGRGAAGQSPDDTFASLTGNTPNGSQASAGSRSGQAAGGWSASPGDTDIFLAVAAQSASRADGSERQSPLPPAQSPISSPDVTAVSSGPVNPLVAARNSGPSVTKGSGSAAQAGLFPIQEGGGPSSSFDTSFGDRGTKRTVVIVVVIVLIVALAFVGAFFGLRHKQAADALTDIDDAIELLRQTDDVIVPLDSAIASQMSTGIASDALSDVMLQSTTTSNRLSSAETLASDADKSRDLLEASDASAIDSVQASITARRGLLEVGRMLQSASDSANTALESLAMAYGSVSDASAALESASAEYASLVNAGSTSTGDPWVIVQLDQQAQASIDTAKSWAASAKAEFSAADLSALDAYLDARATEIDLLTQYHTSLINQDAAAAEVLGPQYQAAAEASAAAAQLVPATAADLLVDAYSQMVQSQRDSYEDARARCVEADAQINSYLGISNPSKAFGLSASSSSAGASAAAGSEQAALTDTAAVDAAADEAAADTGADAAAADAAAADAAAAEAVAA